MQVLQILQNQNCVKNNCKSYDQLTTDLRPLIKNEVDLWEWKKKEMPRNGVK